MKSPRHRTSKPARRRDAVAVGRALTRKPKVNPALAALFRANRDLLTP